MKVEGVQLMLLMKFINKEFIRFLVVGLINTISTYLIYLLLLFALSYDISYTLSYLAGIVISYYLNSYYVFKEKISIKKFLKYPIVYVVQYVINLLGLYILVEYLNIPKEVVPLIVIILSIPITYLLSKLIIRTKKTEDFD